MDSSPPSSPQQHHLALPAPPNPSSAAAAATLAVASRRLPPPCWSHDETVALIDAYRDKWYSLRRGNLRANHWQEVAEAVAARCPLSPAKTAVQCRHKMEKLRKRYRAENQRALSTPKGRRFNSSWVHFTRMDSMEKGPAVAVAADPSPTGHGGGSKYKEDDDDDEDGDDDDDEEEELYQSVKRGVSQSRSGKSGFRIRIPSRAAAAPPVAKTYNSKFDGKAYPNVETNPNPNPNFGGSARVVREGFSERWGCGKRERGDGVGVGKKREEEPVAEIVGAIKALGDGFVRMERMKMDMAREVEAMRMEMEMKRTEMILESQQRIVEAFANAFSEKRSKKAKRMPTPES